LYVGIATLSWISLLTHSLLAQPLKSGIFLGPNQQKIQIASQGDRVCYQSLNQSGMVSSATPDPKYRGFYRLDGIPTYALYQPSPNTLLYGELSQLAKAQAVSQSSEVISPVLQECLASKGSFSKNL
jgi:hypothetical protein